MVIPKLSYQQTKYLEPLFPVIINFPQTLWTQLLLSARLLCKWQFISAWQEHLNAILVALRDHLRNFI